MKMEKKVEEFINMPLGLLTERYYFIKNYLAGYGCEYHDLQSFQNYVSEEKDDFFLNIKMTRQEFACAFYDYLTQVLQAIGEEEYGVDSITIIAGKDKDGAKEQYDSIKLERGSITAIVGKTGSGKSRLLEDIEWAACGDTPTGRTVLLNEKEGNRNEVGKKKRKLIAQLSQNMNFVLNCALFIDKRHQKDIIINTLMISILIIKKERRTKSPCLSFPMYRQPASTRRSLPIFPSPFQPERSPRLSDRTAAEKQR